MINPRNQFRMTWDIAIIMPLLVYLMVMMPFRLCFANEAKPFTIIYFFEFLIDMVRPGVWNKGAVGRCAQRGGGGGGGGGGWLCGVALGEES